MKKKYLILLRPRPEIDRVSSAWLHFRFHRFATQNSFSMRIRAGFRKPLLSTCSKAVASGTRREYCTFENLRKEFGVRTRRCLRCAQMIHDADLDDEKFRHDEAIRLNRVPDRVGTKRTSVTLSFYIVHAVD